jgi:hypothetical protein
MDVSLDLELFVKFRSGRVIDVFAVNSDGITHEKAGNFELLQGDGLRYDVLVKGREGRGANGTRVSYVNSLGSNGHAGHSLLVHLSSYERKINLPGSNWRYCNLPASRIPSGRRRLPSGRPCPRRT